MAAPEPRARSRWAGVRGPRRRPAATATKGHSRRYEQITSNDTLETQVQNDTSPFPPTYTEHVSRREVPERGAVASLARMCIRVAASHFSTHVLPTPEVFAAAAAAERGRPVAAAAPRGGPGVRREPKRRRTRRDDDDFMPDVRELSDEDSSPPPRRTRASEGRRAAAEPSPAPLSTLLPTELLHWASDLNKQLLKALPPTLLDDLYCQLCLEAPMALTKEVISVYFLPGLPPASAPHRPARIRTRLFFPASLPLFSQDQKNAPLLLATLTGSLALSPGALQVSRALRALDLHGITRLQPGVIKRLLHAPTAHTPPAPTRAPPGPPAWSLEHVTLPGCLAMDDAAVGALVDATGHALQHLDLRLTSISTASITRIGSGCPQLRTLVLAACEHFSDETFSEAVSTCVSDAARAPSPRIPFQQLERLDLSHTGVGDVAVGGILRLCGTRLVALDVNHTLVGHHGDLDVLRMGLGLARPHSGSARTPNSPAGGSRLEHLGLAGLCVWSEDLAAFLRTLLPLPGDGETQAPHFSSLLLDDLVEFPRRQQSSLQGRAGVSGDTLHLIALMIAEAAARRAAEQNTQAYFRLDVRGDKRKAHVPSHWALPAWRLPNGGAIPPHAPGDTLRLLLAGCERLALGGLEIPRTLERACTGEEDIWAPLCKASPLRELSLTSTGIRDEALEQLAPWTGSLEALYLDDTPVGSMWEAHGLYRLTSRRFTRCVGGCQPTSGSREPLAVPRHSRTRPETVL